MKRPFGLRRRRRFGALVTPAGLHLVEFRAGREGVQVVHTSRDDRPVRDPADGAGRLVRLIQRAGDGPAGVSVAVHGFGACFHRLDLPSGDPAVLRPIVERELRRVYPDLEDPIVDFTVDTTTGRDAGARREIVAAALPRATVDALLEAAAGHAIRIDRITVPPVAIERFLQGVAVLDESSAVLLVPGGIPMLAFFHAGELQLYREPPVAPDADPEAMLKVVVGEVERGRVFMRQQHRGANVVRLVVAAESRTQAQVERAIDAVAGLDVERLDAGGLSPGGLIAVGATVRGAPDEAMAIAAVAAAIAVGTSALARADAWREREAAFERLLDRADRWVREFEPATPAESAAWRAGEREMREAVVGPGAAVTLAAEVAQSAERLGVLEAAVRFEPIDSLPAFAPERAADHGFRVAPTALRVQLTAHYGTVVRFIGALPPQVRARTLDLTRAGDATRVRLLLTYLQDEGGSDGARTAT